MSDADILALRANIWATYAWCLVIVATPRSPLTAKFWPADKKIPGKGYTANDRQARL
jgi:hypothetical protein